MRTHHLLAQPLQLAPRPGDAGERHAKLRERQPKALGNGLEFGGKLGQTPGIGLGEAPPDLVGPRGAELDPIGIELAAEQTLEDRGARQARGFGNAQQLALGITQVACFRLDLGEEVGDPILLQIHAAISPAASARSSSKRLRAGRAAPCHGREPRCASYSFAMSSLKAPMTSRRDRRSASATPATSAARASSSVSVSDLVSVSGSVSVPLGAPSTICRREASPRGEPRPKRRCARSPWECRTGATAARAGGIDTLRERQLLLAGEQLQLSDMAEIDVKRIAVEACVAGAGSWAPPGRARPQAPAARGSELTRARTVDPSFSASN